MTHEQTLFAPASGFGRAAIAVIRISGPAAAPVLVALGGALPPPRRLSLRTLRDPADRTVLDAALVAWMPGPETFTGEDMAELHLHGGTAVRAGVIRALTAFPGCRAAEAGAFTRRAVLNGRMDLTAAEGVADLIEAETEAQRRQALRQLDGVLGRQVAAWRAEAVDCLAASEAALDFSDEGDVDDETLDAALFVRAKRLRDAIAGALADGRRGERLREGFSVVLAGPPNAGKSTLLNALSRRDAAIVSPVPGTTRDAIEVRLDLGGLPVTLVDTAGLRDTADPVEAEGIARTRRRIAEADLVLMLVPPEGDGTEPDEGSGRTLRVRTKADLEPCPITLDRVTAPGSCFDAHACDEPVSTSSECALGDGLSAGSGIDLAVSAMTGAGLQALLDVVQDEASAALGLGDALVTRERHRDVLERCVLHLDRVAGADAARMPELVAEDLRLAARALGEVGGHVGIEEVLDRLFSGFCIGK